VAQEARLAADPAARIGEKGAQESKRRRRHVCSNSVAVDAISRGLQDGGGRAGRSDEKCGGAPPSTIARSLVVVVVAALRYAVASRVANAVYGPAHNNIRTMTLE
jgi:hypothetical protein